MTYLRCTGIHAARAGFGSLAGPLTGLLALAALLGVGAAIGPHAAAASTGPHSPALQSASLQPLILMPVPEAPHGIPRGHVAARKRHATKLASIQTATSAALAALPLHDETGIGGKLKARIDAAFEENSKDQDLAEARHFYQSRNHAPAWTDHGTVTPVARKVLARLAQARFDGLDESDYAVPGGFDAKVHFGSVDDLVDYEIALTTALARYVRHAAMGRINPRSVSKYITIDPQRPDIVAALESVAASTEPARVLDGFHPTHPGFLALKDALARILASEQESTKTIAIPSGPLIKPGQHDKRIPLLRARLGLEPGEGDETRYDETLAKAVIALQKKHGLPAKGFVGNMTLGVLNGHTRGSRSDVIVNMERWRWLPRELGHHHVHVNIPEFLVRIHAGDKVTHTTRVVVGKARNQTPVFSDEMEYIVVNPTWSVPRSIATKEYLPRLQQDPTYLQRRNIQVLGRGGRVIDPTTVDWASYTRRSMPYRFKQPSGRGNALGNVKFMFPNQHSVYLHDTQSRSLFSRTVRAYSHGCVRVHKPFEFADALLENEPDWNGSKIKRMVGGARRASHQAQDPHPRAPDLFHRDRLARRKRAQAARHLRP